MDFNEIVAKNRSFRRFDQSRPIAKETLIELVAVARLCPSAANRQPLRFICSSSARLNQEIFETLGWAAYLTEWPGPAEGERPAGYIVVLSERSEWKWLWTDLGIAAQTILLKAASIGLGGCMVGNIKKEALCAILAIPEEMEILLVIALGRPAEEVVIEDLPGESIRYYRTEDGVHHVPKRSLSEILLRVHE